MTRILLLLFVLGCGGTVAPPAVPSPQQVERRFWDIRPMVPTTLHDFIYWQMQQCTGMRGGPFEDIEWYTAHFIMRQSDYYRLAGLWISNPRSIILDAMRENNPPVISHELLHNIFGNGNLDHTLHAADFARCEIRPI